MTDLTEQWEKGELPNGWYWVEGSRAEGIYAYTAEYLNNMYRPRNSERIIEPVPSYEEWKELIESEAKSHLQADSYYNKILEIKDYIKKLRSVIQSCSFETDTELKVKMIRIIDNILRN